MVIRRSIPPFQFTATMELVTALATESAMALVFLEEFPGEAVACLEGHLGVEEDFLLEHRGVVEAGFPFI
jgi:hypothetical protein